MKENSAQDVGLVQKTEKSHPEPENIVEKEFMMKSCRLSLVGGWFEERMEKAQHSEQRYVSDGKLDMSDKNQICQIRQIENLICQICQIESQIEARYVT